MRIEQDGDEYNIKLSSYEMGVISDLISDGVTYNRAENYEMKKAIDTETDREKLITKGETRLMIYEKLTAGEVIAQSFFDALPKATITPRKDI